MSGRPQPYRPLATQPASPAKPTTGQRADTRQTAAIRDMLARGIPHQTIAAAEGCTIARVQAVAGIPYPRGPRPVPAGPLPIPDLLAAGHAHPDHDINRLTHRIVRDLAALRGALEATP